jgi:MFS transporter, YNFM family, putative membrane transport protein
MIAKANPARFDRAIFAVALAGFSAFLDLYATQALLPLLSEQFVASSLRVSLTVSATTGAVALASPIIGPLADVLGRRGVIVSAVLALSVPTFLAATSLSLNALIGWRFMQGLFLPAIFAVTIAYISEEWEAVGAGRPMAAYVTGNILGGVTGRFLTALAAAHFSWRVSFVALGCLNVVAGLLLVAWLPKSRRFVPEANVRSSLRLSLAHLKDPRMWAAYAVGFSVLFSIVAVFTYVNFYLAAPPFRLSTAALGSIFFVYLAGVVATPWAGRWLNRIGYRAVFFRAMLLAMFGVVLTLIPTLWAIIVGLALCAAGTFICQSAANSYVGAAAGRARSSAAGLYVAFYYLGGTVGAVLPGLVFSAHGWAGCVALIISVQLLAMTIALSFWGRATGVTSLAASQSARA